MNGYHKIPVRGGFDTPRPHIQLSDIPLSMHVHTYNHLMCMPKNDFIVAHGQYLIIADHARPTCMFCILGQHEK